MSQSLSELSPKIKAYFAEEFKSHSYSVWSSKPLIEKFDIPDREYTIEELYIIALIILFYDYTELINDKSKRFSDEEDRSSYDLPCKSRCKIAKNIEFDFYIISLSIFEEDLENEKMKEMGLKLREYLRAIQNGTFKNKSEILGISDISKLKNIENVESIKNSESIKEFKTTVVSKNSTNSTILTNSAVSKNSDNVSIDIMLYNIENDIIARKPSMLKSHMYRLKKLMFYLIKL